MTIDNSERSAPANFNDTDMLEIARRIERKSGSNYRINGRDVRARDVQILFADASTGARSPAFVHQGRIGEIIRPSPSSAAACWKKPPAFPACMPAATRPNCGSRRPKPICCAPRTSSASSAGRWRR